ncbi:MAG TPA: energy transducer TonB, partial [Rhodocyclaceae bacterium]|nr:energy transducer TonB [Rhodocyclaceae bacterium]
MHLVPLICLGLGVLAVDCAAAQVCGIARENVPNKALIYPEESLRLGEQGTTVLNARISDLGYVETVDVKESSGYPRLDQVAVDTVKDWCFTPANKEGKNVSASVVIPLKFSLTSSPPLPTTEPLATPVRQPVETNTIVSSFVAQKDGFLAPQQVYGLTVELFARSYFFDLMSARKMGVDHPGWARKFPEFLDDMLVLLRPKNISLESYLERELLAQMEKNDLVNLISATKQPRYLGAVECLKGMGVSWEYLIQANSILQAPTLYSSEE